jgi:hypothetical protein
MILNKLSLSYGKILKLTNVVSVVVEKNDLVDFKKNVELLDNYVKSKGAQPIGPLVQKTQVLADENGDKIIKVMLLRQSSNFIVHVESPYCIDSIIRVKDCVYVRYIGPEDKANIAVDKINVQAFEDGIELCDEIYIVSLGETDGCSTVDVFIAKK